MTKEELALLERTLTAALYAIWKAQGKRKKIVTLPQVDTTGQNVVILQQMTGVVGLESHDGRMSK